MEILAGLVESLADCQQRSLRQVVQSYITKLLLVASLFSWFVKGCAGLVLPDGSCILCAVFAVKAWLLTKSAVLQLSPLLANLQSTLCMQLVYVNTLLCVSAALQRMGIKPNLSVTPSSCEGHVKTTLATQRWLMRQHLNQINRNEGSPQLNAVLTGLEALFKGIDLLEVSACCKVVAAAHTCLELIHESGFEYAMHYLSNTVSDRQLLHLFTAALFKSRKASLHVAINCHCKVPRVGLAPYPSRKGHCKD